MSAHLNTYRLSTDVVFFCLLIQIARHHLLNLNRLYSCLTEMLKLQKLFQLSIIVCLDP